jgi:hypothetical protein
VSGLSRLSSHVHGSLAIANLHTMRDAPNKPIAIIGSACRFAGDATSPSKLWKLLQNPHDVRSEIPESRFRAKSFYNPDAAYHGHSNVVHSYLVSVTSVLCATPYIPSP